MADTILALDTFTDADDTAIRDHSPESGGPWSCDESETSPVQAVINGNKLAYRPNTPANTPYYSVAAMDGKADGFVEAEYYAFNDVTPILFARQTGVGVTMMDVELFPNAGSDGEWSFLSDVDWIVITGVPFTPGVRARIVCEGNNAYAYFNDVLKGTIATYQPGGEWGVCLALNSQPGVTTAALDNFKAGTESVGPTLVSIAVTPDPKTIKVGETQPYTAIGTYDDESTADITDSVDWDTSNHAIATINGSGVATGVDAGTVTVSATSGLIEGTATLHVIKVASIAVTPVDATIKTGGTQQYTAIATFTDESTLDVTNLAIWESSDTDVATIVESTGLATGVAEGVTTISATYAGEEGHTSLYVSNTTYLRKPRLRFFDLFGKPLAGGKLYLCEPGSLDLTNKKASWHDYRKTILNPNPIFLDAHGYAPPIFSDTTYKMFVYDADDGFIASYDNVWNETLGLLDYEEAVLQFFNSNGEPLENGKLYTCVPGAATLNQRKTSYSNALLSTPNTNPIILDAEGKATIYSSSAFYKLFLFDENDVPVLTQDNVGPLGAQIVPRDYDHVLQFHYVYYDGDYLLRSLAALMPRGKTEDNELEWVAPVDTVIDEYMYVSGLGVGAWASGEKKVVSAYLVGEYGDYGGVLSTLLNDVNALTVSSILDACPFEGDWSYPYLEFPGYPPTDQAFFPATLRENSKFALINLRTKTILPYPWHYNFEFFVRHYAINANGIISFERETIIDKYENIPSAFAGCDTYAIAIDSSDPNTTTPPMFALIQDETESELRLFKYNWSTHTWAQIATLTAENHPSGYTAMWASFGYVYVVCGGQDSISTKNYFWSLNAEGTVLATKTFDCDEGYCGAIEVVGHGANVCVLNVTTLDPFASIWYSSDYGKTWEEVFTWAAADPDRPPSNGFVFGQRKFSQSGPLMVLWHDNALVSGHNYYWISNDSGASWRRTEVPADKVDLEDGFVTNVSVHQCH